MSMTPFPPLDRTAASFKDDLDSLFGVRVPNFVNELNTTTANLNSIAAGGAYAIPFKISTQSFIGGSAGFLATNLTAASFAAADTLYMDSLDAMAGVIKGRFDDLYYSVDNLSAVKGRVRIQKVGDPSKWITFKVTAWGYNPATNPYGTLTVTATGYSSANPFSVGDMVIMFCDRTGDKGDKGDNGTSLVPSLWIRDEKPSGTQPQTIFNGTNVRTFNTTTRNSISGASLSANRFVLPAGTYRWRGSAPAVGCGAHQAHIFNVTANTPATIGTSGYSAGGVDSRSIIIGDVTLAAPTTFELRHWVGSSSGSLGSSAGVPGGTEVYSELYIEKLA